MLQGKGFRKIGEVYLFGKPGGEGGLGKRTALYNFVLKLFPKPTDSTWHSKAALFHCISCLHLHTPSSPSSTWKQSALMSPSWQKESLEQALPSISSSERVPFLSETFGGTHSPQSWIMSGSSHWQMPHSQVVFAGHPE